MSSLLSPVHLLLTQLVAQFNTPYQQDNFQALLAAQLSQESKSLYQNQWKSASALSRFLTQNRWQMGPLILMIQAYLLTQLLKPHGRGRCPDLYVMVDLISIEKTGKCKAFQHWLHYYHECYGLHLVVFYLCCGQSRIPWSVAIFRGKGMAVATLVRTRCWGISVFLPVLMPKPYSQDLRQKVINAIEFDGMKRCEAAELFGISRNSINLLFQHKRETGSLKSKKRESQGHNYKITDWDAFERFVCKHHDKTQVQMAVLWPNPISARTMGRGIQKIGFTRKKKSYGYRERDEQKRAEFRKQLAPLLPESLVFADESGIDNRDEYGYGYSPKGERIEALKLGRRSGRINMIAAYYKQTLLAPFTVEGSCNREVCETWIETCLAPVLKTGQKLIIDNASFHKGGRIEELVKVAGCEVCYLPPYSPDMNKIERCWSSLKSRVRR